MESFWFVRLTFSWYPDIECGVVAGGNATSYAELTRAIEYAIANDTLPFCEVPIGNNEFLGPERAQDLLTELRDAVVMDLSLEQYEFLCSSLSADPSETQDRFVFGTGSDVLTTEFWEET